MTTIDATSFLPTRNLDQAKLNSKYNSNTNQLTQGNKAILATLRRPEASAGPATSGMQPDSAVTVEICCSDIDWANKKSQLRDIAQHCYNPNSDQSVPTTLNLTLAMRADIETIIRWEPKITSSGKMVLYDQNKDSISKLKICLGVLFIASEYFDSSNNRLAVILSSKACQQFLPTLSQVHRDIANDQNSGYQLVAAQRLEIQTLLNRFLQLLTPECQYRVANSGNYLPCVDSVKPSLPGPNLDLTLQLGREYSSNKGTLAQSSKDAIAALNNTEARLGTRDMQPGSVHYQNYKGPASSQQNSVALSIAESPSKPSISNVPLAAAAIVTKARTVHPQIDSAVKISFSDIDWANRQSWSGKMAEYCYALGLDNSANTPTTEANRQTFSADVSDITSWKQQVLGSSHMIPDLNEDMSRLRQCLNVLFSAGVNFNRQSQDIARSLASKVCTQFLPMFDQAHHNISDHRNSRDSQTLLAQTLIMQTHLLSFAQILKLECQLKVANKYSDYLHIIDNAKTAIFKNNTLSFKQNRLTDLAPARSDVDDGGMILIRGLTAPAQVILRQILSPASQLLITSDKVDYDLHDCLYHIGRYLAYNNRWEDAFECLWSGIQGCSSNVNISLLLNNDIAFGQLLIAAHYSDADKQKKLAEHQTDQCYRLISLVNKFSNVPDLDKKAMLVEIGQILAYHARLDQAFGCFEQAFDVTINQPNIEHRLRASKIDVCYSPTWSTSPVNDSYQQVT